MQMVTMVPGQGVGFQCASPNIMMENSRQAQIKDQIKTQINIRQNQIEGN